MTQSLPVFHQRQFAAHSGLEVHVVGRGCTAARPVVKHHYGRVCCENAVYLTVIVAYVLRAVAFHRNGEMHRQYGERIDKNLEFVVHRLGDLLFRSVLLAQEARPFGY